MDLTRRGLLGAGIAGTAWLAIQRSVAGQLGEPQDRIDRRAAVRRHNPVVRRLDPFSSLSIGNGGLLAAVAMMAAGWEGGPGRSAPGFPANGRWDVRHEGLIPWM